MGVRMQVSAPGRHGPLRRISTGGGAQLALCRVARAVGRLRVELKRQRRDLSFPISDGLTVALSCSVALNS